MLMNSYDNPLEALYDSSDEIMSDICSSISGFSGMTKCMSCGKHPVFWPVNESPVLKAKTACETVTAADKIAREAQPPANCLSSAFGKKLHG